jgi:hypothetical protein
MGNSDERLKLEAEMGRLFLQIEQAKAAQAQCTQRINEILQQLREPEKEQEDNQK